MNPFDLLKQIKQKKNPFKPLNAKEKADRVKLEKEVQEDILRLARICEDILRDQRYKEFADLFRSIENNVIDLMVSCDEKDRDKFFLQIKEYQMKLRIFKNILKMPHDFIERGAEIQRTVVK